MLPPSGTGDAQKRAPKPLAGAASRPTRPDRGVHMAKPNRARKLYRYSVEFRATAVRLSNLPGVRVQDVAESLDVHPFLLSRWRREAREGRLKARTVKLDDSVRAELKELREVKRAYVRLKHEHELLKKNLRFASGRRSSGPSRGSAKRARSR
jgi:transposase